VATRRAVPGLLAILAVLAATSHAPAEDVQRKWRVSFAVGGFNSQDEIKSPAGNVLSVFDSCLQTTTCPADFDPFVGLFIDPRNDNAVFGSLDINPAVASTVSVQYGLGKIFLVEGSIGVRKGDIGDVEVSAEFLGNPSPDVFIQPFNFLTYRVPVGELTQVPIQVTALARLRPRATFNPYFGAGLGYSIVGFDADPAFNQLSLAIDSSLGQPMRLTTALFGNPIQVPTSDPVQNLEGATVDARDTFEWHLAGGVELTFKRKWAVFADLRWVDASRSVSVGFDGGSELGVSVPSYTAFDTSPLASATYGGVLIGKCSIPTATTPACTPEGLIDAGRVTSVPIEGAPFGTNCDPTNGGNPASPNCVLKFSPNPDGLPDPGIYYVHGGAVDYDGFSLQFGLRYTFKK